ncbi:MAG: DUF4340 domain-containing protein [Acidobacteriota bacterium]
MKQFWKTGLALLVFVGLALYIWRFEWGQEIPSDETKETILAVEKDKVTGISIESEGEETTRLVKVDDAWRVAAPFEAPADSSAVDSILTRVEKLEADEAVVETTDDLAQYGLEAPSRTVSIVVEGQETPLVVEFGDTTPGGSAIYARTPSSPRIFVVASYVESSFEKKPFDLRDRDILHVKRGDVRALEVEGPEGDYSLARTDAGDWAFTKPLATRAGRWSVDGLLGTLENLRMESVAAEPAESLKPYGLDRPRRSVHLVLSDGTTRTLEIGSPAGEEDEGKYYAREKGSSVVAVVPGAVVTDLEKGMGELRAKKLLEVATYDTESFDVTARDTTWTYVKSTAEGDDGFDKTQWKRTSPDEADLETTAVEDALFDLGGVEIVEFLDDPADLASYGLETPLLRVDVRAKGDSWVELGQKAEDYFARRTADAAVLKLDSAKTTELIKALEVLRGPPPEAAEE